MKTFFFWTINALVMKQGIWKGRKNHHFTENNRHYLQPETRPGRGFFRKACKNQDWFTSLPPGFLQSRLIPYPTVGLQTVPEGWAVRAHEPQRGGGDWIVEKKKREEWISMGVRKEGREVTRAVRGTPNQHCVNRPPPGVDRLLGGVLHGPVGLSAEQITDGRNVAFVLKKESRREGGKRRRSSTSGRKRGLQLTSTWCIRTAGPLTP